jgi:transcriptional regulator with XRE-family HTH domain
MPKSQKQKQRSNPKAAGNIDTLIGAKIRRYRTEAGFSQAELGQPWALPSNRCKKCENGKNRVTVARLAQMAATLGVPLTSFLEGLPDLTQQRRGSAGPRPDVPLADQLLATEQGLRLAKGFLAIESQPVRAKLVSLVTAMANGEDTPGTEVH